MTGQLIDEFSFSNKKKITIVRGDITERKVDVIVNAANSYLKHGSGVAGAILKKGGRIIQVESDRIGFVPVGNSVITSSGNLPCSAIIHTVGPRMGEGDEDNKLSRSIFNTLQLATKKEFKTISIPAISSGIFGFPKHKCANILLNETEKFLLNNKTSLDTVEFCILDSETLDHFKSTLLKLKSRWKSH